MINLLNHTFDILNNNGRTYQDILWLSINNTRFDWEDFKRLADKDYNPLEINNTLQIVGKDFIMTWSKNETDGEWWFMEVLPEKPEQYLIPKTLKVL